MWHHRSRERTGNTCLGSFSFFQFYFPSLQFVIICWHRSEAKVKLKTLIFLLIMVVCLIPPSPTTINNNQIQKSLDHWIVLTGITWCIQVSAFTSVRDLTSLSTNWFVLMTNRFLGTVNRCWK